MKAADRLPHALPLAQAPLDVGDRGRFVLAARDDDRVQGAVEPAVAAAVKPVADDLTGAGRDRGGAAVAGEGGLAVEAAPLRPGDDDLGVLLENERRASRHRRREASNAPDMQRDGELA